MEQGARGILHGRVCTLKEDHDIEIMSDNISAVHFTRSLVAFRLQLGSPSVLSHYPLPQGETGRISSPQSSVSNRGWTWSDGWHIFYSRRRLYLADWAHHCFIRSRVHIPGEMDLDDRRNQTKNDPKDGTTKGDENLGRSRRRRRRASGCSAERCLGDTAEATIA